MNIKKYSTEELKEIISNYHKIRSEYDKRIRANITFEKNDIYYDNNNGTLRFLLIKDVNKKEVIYDFFEFSPQYVDYNENLNISIDSFPVKDYIKLKDFNESFNAMINSFQIYCDKANKLFSNFYSDCFQYIKNLKK